MEKHSVPNEFLLPVVAQMISEGHDVELMTKGCSMHPFILGDRDSVVLRSGDPKVGDIVLAKVEEGGRFVLHRVIKVDVERITLMGDGNIIGTEHCLKSDVAGIVVEILKPGGRRVKPGSGLWWRRLKPIRRYILYIYRHILRWTGK